MADPLRCRCEVQIRRLWETGLDEHIRWVELEGPLSRYLNVCMNMVVYNNQNEKLF
jgi:hypothetical protein